VDDLLGLVMPTVRRATRTDVAAILALLASDDLHRAREAGMDPTARLRAAERAFDEIDADPKQLLWVAAGDDGEVIGTLQITFLRYLSRGGASVALVEAVQVDASVRNQGIGSMMMRAAIDEARKRGCNRVQLTSNKARTSAHRFYERLGFTRSHEGFKLYFDKA
jgi:GNAT superfamily N-acetyltransferase